MTNRFLVYPLIVVVAMQLVPMLRRDAGWYAAQIAQSLLILTASAGAIFFYQDILWGAIAWTLFAIFVLIPAGLSRLATRLQLQARWRRAAHCSGLAGRLMWGNLGRMHRRRASALRLIGRGDWLKGLGVLDELSHQPLPGPARGAVRLWILLLLVIRRDWEGAVTYHGTVPDWGTLTVAAQARLLAARAYAERGQLDRAMHCLQLVAVSPRCIGAMERQFWSTRVAVAALAGDEIALESLLTRRPGVPQSRSRRRFAASWRGRCALVRGEQALAVKELKRAFGLTSRRDRLWHETLSQYRQQAEAGQSPATFAAQTDAYNRSRALLEQAVEQSAGWRALMHLGKPERATLALVLVLVAVFATGSIVLSEKWQERIILWAANAPDVVTHGQWWRVLTALFLHANLLHLAMNAIALWVFGSAVEKTLGRWQLLLIFLISGMTGNFLSALRASYDLAIGASGGIFGVIGAFAVAIWRLKEPMYAPLKRRLLLLLALVVTADLTIGWLEPQVDNLAHAGGFAAGILLAGALSPRRSHPTARVVDAAPAV
jgi:membrane associated rhomboid family serine protease